jgi:hypothetical protein
VTPAPRPPGAAPARPIGAVTRGTTAPGRLRRVDGWLAAHWADRLRARADPLVVDLGFGASPVTTVELHDRLTAAARRRLRVVGLEIDPVRVAAATAVANPPSLMFAVGGFELAGLRPVLVRAMNVLRQYDEAALAPGGVLVEGTCDEAGRVGSWVALDGAGPRSLTLHADLGDLASPAVLAQRLPKALIHRNVPGERVYDLLTAMEREWRSAAPYAAFGPRQRWWHMIAALRGAGWPVLGGPAGWLAGRRDGVVTLRWSAVDPTLR